MKKILIVIDAWELDFINTLLFFLSDQYKLFRRINKFLNNRSDIDAIIIASYDDKKTSSIIKNLQGKKIYATKITEIEKYLENVETVFLAGSAWDGCIKDRELGYLNLHRYFKEKNKVNINIKDDCVIYSEEHKAKIFDPMENLEWRPTEEKGVYRYQPNM
jgi:hypothetical protein